MPLEFLELLAAGSVPQNRCLVTRPGDDLLAVPAQRHANDQSVMLAEFSQLLAAGRVPQDRRAIGRSSDETLAIGAKRQSNDRLVFAHAGTNITKAVQGIDEFAGPFLL